MTIGLNHAILPRMVERDSSQTQSVTEKLTFFARTEQRRRERYQPLRTDRLENTIADYTTTTQFRSVFQEAQKYFSLPYDDEELQQILGCLAGRILQDVGEAHLLTFSDNVTADQQDAEVVRINAAQTLEVYHMLYPNARLIPAAFELSSLEGISVPDGMVLKLPPHDQPKVIAVYETSLSQHPDYYQRKFLAHRINQDNHRRLLGDAEILFLPTETEEDALGVDAFFQAAAFHHLPFTRSAFYHQVGSLVASYRATADTPSLAEFQDQARRQDALVTSRIMDGTYGPEEFRYLEHVGTARQNHKPLFQSERKGAYENPLPLPESS